MHGEHDYRSINYLGRQERGCVNVASVRGTIFKGRLVQGAQHPRTFGQGHIGRGHFNSALFYIVRRGHWLICPYTIFPSDDLSFK